MTPEDVGGKWDGTIAGTNTGRCRLVLTPVPTGLVAEAILDDDAAGTARLVGTGTIDTAGMHLTLINNNPVEANQFGTITVSATITQSGVLTGTWQTTVGTSGTLEAHRAVEMAPQVQPEQPVFATASATEKRLRIPSCVVDVDALKRILAALRAGAEEAARLHHAKQQVPQPLSLARLKELYRVGIILRGAQGELVLSAEAESLASEALPKPLQSVEFEIGFHYRFTFNQQQAPNRATLTLDFTKPSAFDLSNPSGAPTPNSSSFTVYGSEPIWVAGIFENTRAILQQGAVHTGWLHGAHIYDILLFILGMPLVLAAAVLAASGVHPPATTDGRFFGIAVFLFVAVTALNGFRLAFSLTRWLLPYVEFASAPEPLHRRLRVLIATLVIGAVASLAAAAIWVLFQRHG